HELACLRPAGREAHPEDDVVKARLEQAQQILAGHAGAALGRLEVALELTLVNRVHAPDLLLLAQLDAEAGHLAPAHTVLAGRRWTALERALLGVALGALEVELHALAPAQA